ncbi:MAG TPA: adenosylcobinamide-phosphate synthase [Bacillus bacterium]|nr:adenosylcobinamide-phosphate synthase [Bacillus sp. (in: firmicutes)]
MILHHMIAIIIAVILDWFIGDPPDWPHPVKWMGSLISRLDRYLNSGSARKAKGIVMLTAVLFIVGSLAILLTWTFYMIHPAAGILMEAVLISTTIAQKSLKEAALTVYQPLKNGDIDDARHKLSYIVGRDTDKLDESEVVRGAVETVAENTSDGITSPLFWALIGGAPFALIYRAINTCDSMVGYKNERYLEFGWASARLDDAANWIPSRITSICMLIGKRPHYFTRKKAWAIIRRDARKHPSPNSGWGEAAVAAILCVQLGGVNYYNGILSNRATMGDPLVPLEKSHILNVNEMVTITVIIFLLFLLLGGVLFEMASSWIQSTLFV